MSPSQPQSGSTSSPLTGWWDTIFKDTSWLDAVSNMSYIHGSPPPLPALVGCDLESSQPPSYLALLVSDWGGDVVFQKEKLFASFREPDYHYNEELSEVKFPRSSLTLHVGDAVQSDEWIQFRDPSRLFRQYGGSLETCVAYYAEDCIRKIGPSEIGGIEDFSGLEHIRYMCSLRLKFGNGKTVYRVLQASTIPQKLVSKRTKNEDGELRITSWRAAIAGERAWSFV